MAYSDVPGWVDRGYRSGRGESKDLCSPAEHSVEYRGFHGDPFRARPDQMRGEYPNLRTAGFHNGIESRAGIEMRNQRPCTISILAACILLCVAVNTSRADIALYSQDFETLDIDSTTALEDDGWVVFGNVYSGIDSTYLYGYGTFPAPNGGEGFCAIVTGEGGAEQGLQQLSVYNDYNNLLAHDAGDLVEANVFIEQTIGAADIGKTYVFEFDAKLGNLTGGSTAAAFIKTLDPSNGFALTNSVTVDMTSIPTTWGTYSVKLTIDSSLNAQLFQFGFLNVATSYVGSGVFYDNVELREATTSAAPVTPSSFVLHQNVPNPFNPATRISFELTQSEAVTINVYDATGRRVVTLLDAQRGAGPHSVTWNGLMSNGTQAAAGIYRYVLETSAGRTSRSMVLLK